MGPVQAYARRADNCSEDMKVPNNTPDLRPFYILLVGVGGICAHLASEFAAMGADARGVLFSARHWYLGAAVLAGVVAFVMQMRSLWSRSANVRDFKRLLHNGLSTLPRRGSGVQFFALTAGLQFAIGMCTEAGEGAPIAGHDVVAGVFGALLVVLALAFATKAISRSMPRIVEVVAQLFLSCNAGTVTVSAERRSRPSIARPAFFPDLYNRPPPASSLS